MSYYAINSETLTSMADIVRSKTETTDQKTIEDIKGWMEESSSKSTYHTVNFYNGETLIESVQVLDGETAFCRADLSAVKASAPEGQYLSHFYPIPTNVTSDMDVYAQFSTPDYEYTEISDSLEEIVASIKDGSVGMKYPIGQVKTVPLSDGTSSTIQLTQIYPDFVPAVNGDVIMTRWITKELRHCEIYDFKKPCFFQTSNVYESLNSSFNDNWPDIIKSNVKTRVFTIVVTATWPFYTKNQIILDRVSIPEISELNDDRTLLFKVSDDNSRKKYTIINSDGQANFIEYMTCSYSKLFEGALNMDYSYVSKIRSNGVVDNSVFRDLKLSRSHAPIAFSM